MAGSQAGGRSFPSMCLTCGSLSTTLGNKVIVCHACGSTVSAADYKRAHELGFKCIRYGIQYRRIYESQVKRQGRITRFCALGDPSTLLVFIGMAMAAGIIGNGAYDAVKFCLKGLARSIKRRKKVSPSHALGQAVFATQRDVDMLFDLLADDNEFDRWAADIADYLDGMPKANKAVRQAVIGENSMHDMAARLKRDLMSKYAFVNTSGKVYHRIGCRCLKSDARKVPVSEAKRLLVPCKVCDPAS